MNETEALRILRELFRLFDQADRCTQCVGPEAAFVGPHSKTWESLRRRARKLLDTPRPN